MKELASYSFTFFTVTILYLILVVTFYYINKKLKTRQLITGTILILLGFLYNFSVYFFTQSQNLFGSIIGLVGIIIMVYKMYEMIMEIRSRAFRDHLTGLYNRRFFENERKRLDKSRNLPISIIIADIDNLKYINDNQGHHVGDQCIKRVAEVIESVTRDGDIVARRGGDEFAILLPETSSKTSKQICQRIRNMNLFI